MASKIKVDQIQTADGTGTIALQNQLSGMTTASLPALGSAQMPSGSVLQVLYVETNTQTAMSGGTDADILTKSFTRKAGDSFFIMKANVYISPVSNADNQDAADPSLRFEINNTQILQTANSAKTYGGFYGSDVPMFKTSAQHNGMYDVHLKSGFAKSTLTGNAGDTVEISLVAQCGTAGLNINRSYSSHSSRGCSMLEIIEVQS